MTDQPEGVRFDQEFYEGLEWWPCYPGQILRVGMAVRYHVHRGSRLVTRDEHADLQNLKDYAWLIPRSHADAQARCLELERERDACCGDYQREAARAVKAEAERDEARCALDETWYCPECGSDDTRECSHADDFGSRTCRACGYTGSPGEDFPTAATVLRERDEARAQDAALQRRILLRIAASVGEVEKWAERKFWDGIDLDAEGGE